MPSEEQTPSEPEDINIIPAPNPAEEESLAHLVVSIPLPSQETMATQTISGTIRQSHICTFLSGGGGNPGPSGRGSSHPLWGRQPGGPFIGGGMPGGDGGGDPPSRGGRPGGGGPGGGRLGIGDPNQPNAPRSSDCFIGKEPQVFTGDCTKADKFFTQWNLFVRVNFNNLAMVNAFSRAMLFLTYMQGPHVNEWVLSQHRWLVNEVTNNGVHPEDQNLWNTVERAFRRNFANTLEQEHAQAILKKGIRMQGENMDNYIAQFEHLACQARYHLDNPQTLDLFNQGLLDTLYMKIYKLDDPQDYKQWKQCALDQQCQFIHVKAHLNCYKSTSTLTPHPSTNWGPHPNQGQPRFNTRDPNAMDTSPGRVHA